MPADSPSRAIPAVLLTVGCLLLFKVGQQEEPALRAPLATLPGVLMGLKGQDQTMAADEQEVAGVSDYLLRSFNSASGEQVSLYVGYYPSQTQGRTIHSPKNCLPGSGWEPLAASVERVKVGGDEIVVNRYELANGSQRALVYYWYQGRGRVAANEYRIKLDLLRDAMLRGRTEEALVRVVVPLTPSVSDTTAERLARGAVAELVPALRTVLPS